MIAYQHLPDHEAEPLIFAQMQAYDDAEKLRYAAIGLMCLAVNKRSLWKHRMDPTDGLPCASFARWLKAAAPYAYSTAYSAMRDCEALTDVPDADLAQVTAGNFGTLKQLSTSVRRDPSVIQAAKTQRPEQFVETVRKSHPEQALEHRKPLRFSPPESAVKVIEEALTMAEERGATSRNEALEAIAATALDQWRMEAEVEATHAKATI